MEDIRGEEKLPRSMFGFIQNSGITKASKAMKEEKKSKPMLWFVDVSSASDNIRRGKIYRKLESMDYYQIRKPRLLNTSIRR